MTICWITRRLIHLALSVSNVSEVSWRVNLLGAWVYFTGLKKDQRPGEHTHTGCNRSSIYGVWRSWEDATWWINKPADSWSHTSLSLSGSSEETPPEATDRPDPKYRKQRTFRNSSRTFPRSYILKTVLLILLLLLLVKLSLRKRKKWKK